MLLRGIEYYDWEGVPVAPCDTSKYLSLYIRIEGKYFEIPPSVYVMPYDFGEGFENHCVIGFTINESDYFLLGDTFLRSYYSIHDDEGGKLGLVP